MDKGVPGVKFKYRSKTYFVSFLYFSHWNKKGKKIRPIDKPEDKSKEITVKDYKVGKWNVTVNVNGETIIVGWGPVKHFTIWGSIVLLIVIIIYTVRQHRAKKRDKWLKQNAKRWPNYF